MKQTIEIEVPEGYKAVYDKDTQMVEIVKVELPKTWEEFCEENPIGVGESFIYDSCVYCIEKEMERVDKYKEALPNKETAEAFLALMQLIQLRDCYRQGWKPDWKDTDTPKYAIVSSFGKVAPELFLNMSSVLSFQSAEIRDEFLNNFRDLIEQAKELI